MRPIIRLTYTPAGEIYNPCRQQALYAAIGVAAIGVWLLFGVSLGWGLLGVLAGLAPILLGKAQGGGR